MAEINKINKKEILKIFISHFNEFLEDIISIFPEDKEINFLKDFLCLYASINKSKLIQIWKECVVEKYETEINNKNYEFFINKDWRNDIKNIKNNDIIIDKINKIRLCIYKMDESNKLKAIKYIDNLTKLCNLYNN